MTNVKTLPGVKLKDDGPVEDVVRVLERLLGMAQSGRLRSVIAVGANQDQIIDAIATGETNPYLLAGAMGILLSKMQFGIMESEQYEPD